MRDAQQLFALEQHFWVAKHSPGILVVLRRKRCAPTMTQIPEPQIDQFGVVDNICTPTEIQKEQYWNFNYKEK